jgi:hypothetical protein
MRLFLLIVLACLAAALALPAASTAQTRACPCTVFGAGDEPGGNAVGDDPIEIGMKITASEAGFITSLRFYKQSNNTGRHVGHLWSSSGTQLAEVEFTGETASGWQDAPLADPVPVTAGTTYVVSYHSANGRFGMTAGGLASAAGTPPLTAPASGAAGGNGVYHYGASGFPADSWNASNYWVDATFERSLSGDTRAPRIDAITPADGAAGVPASTTVTATFDEPLAPASVSSQTFQLRNGGGTTVAGSVSYDAASRKATLTPSAPLPLGQTYTATVKGGADGVKDVAGNPLAADRSWSFTGSRACPCSVFGTSEGPLGAAAEDTPIEVGMKIQPSEDGFITALRFYKQTNNTGRHVGHLWASSGTQLAEAEFTGETASGWQVAVLPNPIPVVKDATYVTSYYATNGRYAFSPGFFFGTVGQPPLTAPGTGNGVYRYGASGFPTESWNGTNYWVDATFDRDQPGDTRPPQVSSSTPASDATGVSAGAKVTATFDEPVDPLTVNSGSFALKDAASVGVPANVAYDAATRTATLTPSAPLQYGKTYTATLKGGATGVADPDGNRLAADRTWSFSTAAQCPCTLFASTDAPAGQATKDQPIEVGVRFTPGEDGFITSLRFYKQSNNTGTHVGHLWSAGGQLLAAATYRNETASGWQEAELENPVAVTKDTTYISSYHSSAGYFAFEPGGLQAGINRPPMRAPASTSQAGNGVFRYGASGFPDQSFNATNYWVDATFQRVIPPDTRGPSVTETSPTADATDVPRSSRVTATFDEPLNPASVTATTFTLRDPQGQGVTATVSYDATTRTAELRPTASLAFDTQYTATLKAGAQGVKDTAGNPLAAEKTWKFTAAGQSPADGPGGPILVVTNPNDKFSTYYAEILRSEGLNAFSTTDGPVTSDKLAGRTVVLLGTASVTDAEAALLTTWVQGGGNLIAMRPDKKLAGLLGLTDGGGALTEGYLKVDRTKAAGAGIDAATLQYHGAADRYNLSGASALATLYSNATTATANPAVSLRAVGANGGQAAAFTFDLARSVVYTRQGNPAWAGQKRDGLNIAIRSNDLFYGAKAGDVQPDWVDPNRFEVPQADEQQRLLANLITDMNLDAAPLPRFWYLPRGAKAVLTLTGDDHAHGGTPAYLNRLKTYDKSGCSVADWECVRASSYMYPDTPVTDTQAAAFQADGFELALHLQTGCQNYTPASLQAALTSQLSAFRSAWPSLRNPVSNRTHCTVWSDWATQPKLERQNGIRYDTNYYYVGPAAWMRKPGLMTGSGFPQRFADLDGSMIDVYQATTQVTDEAEDIMRTTAQMHTLLDNALGAKGYYGVLNAILHTDNGDHKQLNDMVSEAVERGVPVVSSAQVLEWLDGRNGSSFSGIAHSAGRLTFSVVTNSKARGLEAMLPARSARGPLSRLTRNGQPVSWTRRTVKGIDYVVFKGAAGSYEATYAADTTPPAVSQVAASADDEGRATVTWTTDEPSTSRVDYGRTSTLGSQVTASAPVAEHRVELTGLSPGTTYSFRVTSTDAAGNTAQSALSTFATPPGGLVDNRTAEFSAGTRSNTYAGATLDGLDGEVQLQPVIGQEFEGSTLPAGWLTSAWGAGGGATMSNGGLFADGAAAYPSAFNAGPRVLEFSATFRPINNQGVGLSRDFSDYPLAAFTTANSKPFSITAASGANSSTVRETPLPGVAVNVPHRFRIEWKATSVEFYVDGALVATHPVTISQDMRPVVSDYGIFGAGVRVHWLRQGSYTATGTFTSRVLDGGATTNVWQSLASTRDLPTGTTLAFDTRSGATATPDASWSAWQPTTTAGAIASPASRYIQYRARMGGGGLRTATLRRVSVTFTAGASRTLAAGSVSVAPAAPTTNQIVTATASGFDGADDNRLTYHYRWLRNGKPIPGATARTLDLSKAGNGDRGDDLRVEVYATNGRRSASDKATRNVTVADSSPTTVKSTIAPVRTVVRPAR